MKTFRSASKWLKVMQILGCNTVLSVHDIHAKLTSVFVVITVPVDGLTLSGAKTFAGTVMIMSESHVYKFIAQELKYITTTLY